MIKEMKRTEYKIIEIIEIELIGPSSDDEGNSQSKLNSG